MGTPTEGALTTWAIDDSEVTAIGDFDGNSLQYEVLQGSDLVMAQEHVHSNGLRGTRSRNKTRCRISKEYVRGSLSMNPTPVELDQWFPRALGAAESSNTFALAETVPVFSALIDKIVQRHIYAGLYVSSMTVSGSQGELINFTFDIEGKTEILSATSFPGTVPAIDTGSPYVFSDCTFALGADASAAQVRSFTLKVDNMPDTERFLNSVTRTALPARDRLITLSMVVPYTADEKDLYDQAIAGNTGSLTLTNGGCSTVFTFANIKCPAETPPVPGKDELFLTLNMTSLMSGSDRELVVTHDSTP